jgi:hypothetical protein
MRVALVHGSRHQKELKYLAKGIRLFDHTARLVHVKDTKTIAKADSVVTYGNVVVDIGNRDWLHMDSAFLKRGKYFRISLNCNQPDPYLMDINRPPDRWDKLGAVIEPWKINKNGPIIICASSRRNFRMLNLNYKTEINRVHDELKKHQKIRRKIIFREKRHATKGTSLYHLLSDAYALVTWSSGAAVEAVLRGVPVFVLYHSAATPVARTCLDHIEFPFIPNREQWAYNLAYQQWTLNECKLGIPWKQLIEDRNAELIGGGTSSK